MNFAGTFILIFCCAPVAVGQILSSQYRQQNALSTSNAPASINSRSHSSTPTELNPNEAPNGFQPVQVFRADPKKTLETVKVVKKKNPALNRSKKLPQSTLPEPVLLPYNSEIVVSSLPKIFNK